MGPICPKCGHNHFRLHPMPSFEQGIKQVYLVTCTSCGAVIGAVSK